MASLSFAISQSLLKLMSIELVTPSNHLPLCHPLLLLPSIFPSLRVFSNKSALYIMRPKYWNFSFNISPSDEYSRLNSFRTDWFDLLAIQGILKIHQFLAFSLLYGPGLFDMYYFKLKSIKTQKTQGETLTFHLNT